MCPAQRGLLWAASTETARSRHCRLTGCSVLSSHAHDIEVAIQCREQHSLKLRPWLLQQWQHALARQPFKASNFMPAKSQLRMHYSACMRSQRMPIGSDLMAQTHHHPLWPSNPNIDVCC